ncbi:hypothetical protein GCM10007852_23310 [Agaribacter marinus]|uniref:Uncharacterized protein n=1 Tax=Agaribacter marinus TaxID=1431249 RepID=A0AA37T3G9_9ALTE|nr:hypothetical protein GCM10007852_23310 [Agaribacter marinus]
MSINLNYDLFLNQNTGVDSTYYIEIVLSSKRLPSLTGDSYVFFKIKNAAYVVWFGFSGTKKLYFHQYIYIGCVGCNAMHYGTYY